MFDRTETRDRAKDYFRKMAIEVNRCLDCGDRKTATEWEIALKRLCDFYESITGDEVSIKDESSKYGRVWKCWDVSFRQLTKAMEKCGRSVHVYLTGSGWNIERALYKNNQGYWVKWQGRFIEVTNLFPNTYGGWKSVKRY